jgi:hypothetical protein
MDLKQIKLDKNEWNSIEVPVSADELTILNLIKDGYNDVNLRINKENSIFTFLKIGYNENTYPKIEEYLFNKYIKTFVNRIEPKILQIEKKLFVETKYKKITLAGITRLNSADNIRLSNCNNIDENKAFEFILLKFTEKTLCYFDLQNIPNAAYNYYTLLQLYNASVPHMNKYVVNLAKYVINMLEAFIDKKNIIENAVNIIETNKNLLKYSDLKLYDHQKRIFTICKNPQPKLVLYIAPTGTGKTLTPIGLSEENRIIFVCAARHVGLALARSSISLGKRIAFAFGCNSADDIRLHYFAAKEYTKHRKSGGIGKVDNSVGDDVEIMICDIKSYLPAMYYMMAFNDKSNIIMYWDEPTITMDYETHEFHSIIQNNWRENQIPNIVLSSATLPKFEEIPQVLEDFRNNQFVINCFADSTYDPIVENITSHDCKKSIPIINNAGFVVLPHYLEQDYEETKKIALHCESNKTLLRYFDLNEVVKFISYINESNFVSFKFLINRRFESVNSINMISIKEYYLTLLLNIKSGTWGAIYMFMKTSRIPKLISNNTINSKGIKILKKISSVDTSRNLPTNNENVTSDPDTTIGVYISTKHAFSLTDGPTIYICENVQKIAMFCIQQANIPSTIMLNILKKIEFNNTINKKIFDVENEIEYKLEQQTSEKSQDNNKSKTKVKNNKMNRDTNNTDNNYEMSRLTTELNQLRSMIKSAVLNDTFIPNTTHHIDKWAKDMDSTRAFSATIDEHIVCNIMSLNGIEDSWKVLLMMGIGVFINHPNKAYTEIMKTLADEQKLFMIIASSDYIYGTNYQFCHAYLGKDLNLTQEKIIQAMGRVGRNNIQQTYTLRFRDNSQILKLFTNDTAKPEVINMNALLRSTI